jgi:hypothetical protein
MSIVITKKPVIKTKTKKIEYVEKDPSEILRELQYDELYNKPIIKQKPKKKIPTTLDKWRRHLKKYRDAHPSLSLKECMVNASKTYVK